MGCACIVVVMIVSIGVNADCPQRWKVRGMEPPLLCLLRLVLLLFRSFFENVYFFVRVRIGVNMCRYMLCIYVDRCVRVSA
jgi:hypothetical protein